MNCQQPPTDIHAFLHVNAQDRVSLHFFESILMATYMNALAGF